jgi:hypothetical protein
MDFVTHQIRRFDVLTDRFPEPGQVEVKPANQNVRYRTAKLNRP